MAERRASLMEPRLEQLMSRVDSKFTLVTLASMRAREINDYYNQLGEGLGRIVPPQVTSVSRKPLSIALEEVAAGKIVCKPLPPADTRRRDRPEAAATDRSRRRGRDRLSRVGPSRPSRSATSVGRVVLGVSGGIAAYKAVEVCRLLVDAGALRSPVLTDDAQRFIGAVTLSAVASEPARTSLWDAPEPIPHTWLGQHADLVVVAPATANVIGKYAAGLSDDLLTTTLLATRAPVLVCPAMHTEMWEHASVQENLATLRRAWRARARTRVGAARRRRRRHRAARRACPYRGSDAWRYWAAAAPLAGRHVLVTAGGTREAIDPVRFVGNRSSGKMGHAIAREAARRGAQVTLVTTTEPAVTVAGEVVRVESAEDMYDAVMARAEAVDVVVMAAAVADFRPKAVADQKLKKGDGVPEVHLEPTVDILAALGRVKRPAQYLVGFAAETERVVEHAAAKLRAKNVDLMVANDVAAADSGFEVDTNRAVLIDTSGTTSELPLLSKDALAGVILERVAGAIAST